jgi:3-phenylpropionate/trans-cinnamate dioxygenase ferredoxin component
MSGFVSVLKTGAVAPGEMKLVDLDATEVVVANVGGRYCAFANLCTHEQGPLVEGELEGDVVTCPWHSTEFNVFTGEVVDGLTDEPIAVYPVRVEGDDIQVERPD